MWFGLWVVAIIGVLAYRMFTVETKNKESLNAISQINNTHELLSDDSEQELAQNSALPQYSANEMNTILDGLQPHMFHDDPYIEAKLLFELKSHCRYSSKIKHKCEEVLPRFNVLNKMVTGYQDLKHIPSSSQLGKALQNRMSFDPNQPDVSRNKTRQLLKLLINSKNPYVFAFEGPIFMYEGVDYGEILPFSEWLKSQDQEYNRVVLMYALLKMAHQHHTAESSGLLNEMLCNTNQFVCGLKFEDTFQKLVLPGMLKDVDLLISHLEEFAAGN